MNKLLKLLLALPLVLLCCTLTACGDDDDNDIDNGAPDEEQTSDFAPSSMVGKIIRWSNKFSDGTAGNNNTRVEFITETYLKTNFEVTGCSYTYQKKDANTGHLNFAATQDDLGVRRTFFYDFDLIFTSSSEFNVSGTLTVVYYTGPNAGRKYFWGLTGEGKYVDDLWGKWNE